MKPRRNPYQAAPEAMKAVAALDTYVQDSGLEPSLVELIKMRASQINGCAYCLHMHSRDARAKGETEERLYLLDAWRESPRYTDRERAALAWTEAVTLVSQTQAPDDIRRTARPVFRGRGG
jgi:AhpD family alkylhydroperoxidase